MLTLTLYFFFRNRDWQQTIFLIYDFNMLYMIILCIIPSLISIQFYGFYYMFRSCSELINDILEDIYFVQLGVTSTFVFSIIDQLNWCNRRHIYPHPTLSNLNYILLLVNNFNFFMFLFCSSFVQCSLFACCSNSCFHLLIIVWFNWVMKRARYSHIIFYRYL